MNQEIIRIDLGGVNCYLGKSEEGYVLFDTAGHLFMDKEYTDRREELIRRLEEEGCCTGNLRAIILTHGDCDHTANAAYLRDKYQTVVAIHEKDEIMLKELTVERILENCRYHSVVLKIVFFLVKNQLKKVSTKILSDFTTFQPDVLLKDGEDLSGFGFRGKVIHTPGHTAGSIAILAESGELIVGDTFANAKVPELAPNALNFKQMKESAKKLLMMNVTKIYPGHGEPFPASVLKGKL
ncbi:MBL fold metallo-hydrolase [Lachnospiraceae bacterium MD1]|uniref:MBL fold metallo-hydrolase n=1 Tax=Variimorphobacter saccharofermentans TaxID=2755051 RepID=A0A839JUI5_9FIRM|nr:MBL fold metallo-hydrolase [Variimorphobacter saccharofermentans]MBB2181345.1 MBL fold metallo-hydrolase [Variimorphobacter saccharofermentans]